MTPVVAGVIVCPYRFTAHPEAMTRFLELVGLTVLIRQRDFTVLGGRGGRIAIHPLATAESVDEPTTSFVLSVPDVVGAAEILIDAGVDASWWDEAFGRQASVPGPIGTVTLDGEPEDSYGHDTGGDETPREVDVVATVFASDLDAVQEWFRPLGFAAGHDAMPEWRPLRSGPLAGIVGLHEGAGSGPGDPATTEIGFEITEPFEEFADRLRAAGHPVELVSDVGPAHLIVTDPDGYRLEVYHVG